MSSINLNELWGTTVESITFDQLLMKISMNVIWESNGLCEKRLVLFYGVRSLVMNAEKVFHSKIVELISIETMLIGDSTLVSGELSNYIFEIHCDEIVSERPPQKGSG